MPRWDPMVVPPARAPGRMPTNPAMPPVIRRAEHILVSYASYASSSAEIPQKRYASFACENTPYEAGVTVGTRGRPEATRDFSYAPISPRRSGAAAEQRQE